MYQLQLQAVLLMVFQQLVSSGAILSIVGIITNLPVIPGGFPDSGTALTFTMLFVLTISVDLMNTIPFHMEQSQQ